MVVVLFQEEMESLTWCNNLDLFISINKIFRYLDT